MTCKWDREHTYKNRKAYLRVFAPDNDSERPVVIYEFEYEPHITANEKKRIHKSIEEKYGFEGASFWQMDRTGKIEEISFEAQPNVIYPHRDDLSRTDYENAEKRGLLNPETVYNYAARNEAVSEERQQQILGQVLMSYEQRQNLDMEVAKLPDRAPYIEPDLEFDNGHSH